MPNTPPPSTAPEAEQDNVIRGTVITPPQPTLSLPQGQEIGSDEGAYHSDEVRLPSTVPELIRLYEASWKQCQSLQQLLTQIGTPAASGAASPEKRTSPAPDSVGGVAVTAVATATAQSASGAGVVKGRIVAGAVIPASKDDPSKAPTPLTQEQLHHLISQVVGSRETATSIELECLATRVRELESENETLRSAGVVAAAEPAPDVSDAPSAKHPGTPTIVDLLHAVKVHKQCEDQLRYERAQLHAELAQGNKKQALLEEVTKQLEGQIQRLLTSSVALMGDEAPRQGAATAPKSAASASAASPPAKPSVATGSAGGQDRQPSITAQGTATAPSQRTTGQVAALEKQIDHLRSTVDKLQKDAESGEHRRTKLEAALRKSRQEHAAAKEELLLLRRQLNENEIAAETDATERDSEARARVLEKECIRLRTGFAERRERFTAELTAATEARVLAERQVRVYEHAVPRLLRQLAALQIRQVIAAQEVLHADGTPPTTATVLHPPHPTSESAPGASSEAVEALAEVHRESPTASPTASPASAFADHDQAPAMRTLSHDQQALLNEIKTTYERRLESLQAHMKAETKHMQSLNKELRAALSAAQDEARTNARQLQRLRDSDATAGRSHLQPTPFFSTELNTAFESPERSGVLLSRSESFGTSPLPTTRVVDRGTRPSRELSQAELRYDPEHMPTWEAVQIENEALLSRLSAMQEEKWRLSSRLEDLQGRCAALEDARKQQTAPRSEHLLNALSSQGLAGQRGGGDDARLRALQALLQETLQENMNLQDQLDTFKRRFGRALP